jgi:hypothetical protein
VDDAAGMGVDAVDAWLRVGEGMGGVARG